MRRLSERRSRREIERELRILGAFIEPRNKNSAREKNQFEENKIDENDENSVYERSEEDDGEMALDDTIGENCNVGEINVKSSTEASSKNEDINSPSESTERRVPKNMTTVNKGVDFEMKNKQTSSSLPSFSSENKKLQSSPVDDLRNREEVHSSIESAHNRKRILSTSDDDDFEFDSVNDETPPHQSPSFSKKNKRKRIVLSDSEED
ncbi:hypothetical protein DICVIV_07470 [Dictyocaulus viviparus]|uniref:Uncharacterized protein n=1 Tax=Dictyocaulus viviparus TaxID=29172 RepID=A0A0D8XPK5_DICVI|nr:hypothetical protein DICVIV_07470 [Dictyocaulus viviparus]